MKFEWSHLGDIQLGRPNLGNTTTVAVYRLMQFTLRDATIKHTDPRTAARIFYDAGFTAGKALYENMLGKPGSLDDFVAKLQAVLLELKIGILRVEEADAQHCISLSPLRKIWIAQVCPPLMKRSALSMKDSSPGCCNPFPDCLFMLRRWIAGVPASEFAGSRQNPSGSQRNSGVWDSGSAGNRAHR